MWEPWRWMLSPLCHPCFHKTLVSWIQPLAYSIFLVLTIDRTPLHWSSATGHAHCVALLLRLGSDKNTEDKHEALPLQYAQQGYHSACCKLLIDHDPSNPLATQIPQGKGTINSSWL